MKQHRPWAGYFLAAIGVVGVLFEIALNVYGYFVAQPYELNRVVLIMLVIIGFVGFYLVSPKGAEGGADIITRSAVAIVVAVRSGRRNTDTFTAVVPPDVKPGDAVVVAKPNPPPHPDGEAPTPTADERVELAPNG
jgi:hypothetical protein